MSSFVQNQKRMAKCPKCKKMHLTAKASSLSFGSVVCDECSKVPVACRECGKEFRVASDALVKPTKCWSCSSTLEKLKHFSPKHSDIIVK